MALATTFRELWAAYIVICKATDCQELLGLWWTFGVYRYYLFQFEKSIWLFMYN